MRSKPKPVSIDTNFGSIAWVPFRPALDGDDAERADSWRGSDRPKLDRSLRLWPACTNSHSTRSLDSLQSQLY